MLKRLENKKNLKQSNFWGIVPVNLSAWGHFLLEINLKFRFDSVQSIYENKIVCQTYTFFKRLKQFNLGTLVVVESSHKSQFPNPDGEYLKDGITLIVLFNEDHKNSLKKLSVTRPGHCSKLHVNLHTLCSIHQLLA